MPEPIIEVRNLSKKYNISHQRSYLALRDTLAGALKKPFEIFMPRKKDKLLREDFWALDNVSFDVGQGEVIGIIGRNGAGKTTLLKILSRITYPARGEVRLKGRVGSLLEVGTGFHSELTGRENIYFNGAILGMKKKEIGRKFDEIVDFSGVEKFLDTPVKRFSSGMQVRLAFSVAAHLDPEIILVDEVLSVGDAQFQAKCLGKMKDISRGGRTVLFVSHNMLAIRHLCTRAIMLENGRLKLDADAETTVAKYLEQNLAVGAVISGKELDARIEGRINRASPSLHLKEVALLDENDLPCCAFDSDRPIKIRVTYECIKVVKNLKVCIYIVDDENNVILATQNADNQGAESSYHSEPGIYASTCYIPPDIFGEKRLFVSVLVDYPKVETHVLDKVLGFNVTFLGFNNVSDTIKDSFIRLRLKWDNKLIGLNLDKKEV